MQKPINSSINRALTSTGIVPSAPEGINGDFHRAVFTSDYMDDMAVSAAAHFVGLIPR